MPRPIATLVAKPPYTEEEIERFLAHIPHRPVGRCWVWEGTRDRGGSGYGLFRRRTPNDPFLVRIIKTGKVVAVRRGPRTPIGAHRIAHEIWNGPVGDKIVCHRCDNPGCVRPDHLFAGSYADNSQDMGAKGRHPTVGKLNPTKVREIRRLRSEEGLIQREIAERMGVSQVMVCKVLNGEAWAQVDRREEQ